MIGILATRRTNATVGRMSCRSTPRPGDARPDAPPAGWAGASDPAPPLGDDDSPVPLPRTTGATALTASAQRLAPPRFSLSERGRFAPSLIDILDVAGEGRGGLPDGGDGQPIVHAPGAEQGHRPQVAPRDA